jgi:hypothetical protein
MTESTHPVPTADSIGPAKTVSEEVRLTGPEHTVDSIGPARTAGGLTLWGRPCQHIIAVDQEGKELVCVIDDDGTASFDPYGIPDGGGLIVADANAFGVKNERSKSQFGWESEEDLLSWVDWAEERGYTVRKIPNHLAYDLHRPYDLKEWSYRLVKAGWKVQQEKRPSGGKEWVATKAGDPESPRTWKLYSGNAIWALYDYAVDTVQRTGRFDTGTRPGPSRGDNSFGQRAVVSDDFLRLQNNEGYVSPFAEEVVQIAFDALDREDRPRFNLCLNKRALSSNGSFRLLAAVAVCTHDPYTGEIRRDPSGKPWGLVFITKRIIGLNGQMRGMGDKAPGNPMRAALRRANRYWDKNDPEERSRMDRLVRVLIRAFQEHEVIGGDSPRLNGRFDRPRINGEQLRPSPTQRSIRSTPVIRTGAAHR